MQKHTLTERELCDLEMIISGAFNPLTGFMNETDYHSVIDNSRLKDGSVWTIPIYLLCSLESSIGDTIALHKKDSGCVAVLNIESIYSIDVKKECEEVYGTLDDNHPGVSYLLKNCSSGRAFGGTVKWSGMEQFHFDHSDLRLSPFVWKHRVKERLGWDNVIGFQTRNPLHNSHIQLIKNAMSSISGEGRTGVLIHPTVGPTQLVDIDYNTRVKCYKEVVRHYSKEIPLQLAVIPLAMRMAGPKEAILHAIIRRNYGCTHFIIGRDPAGPSSKTKQGKSFYHPYAAHKLADSLGQDLGISIIKSEELCYSPSQNRFLPKKNVADAVNISGTEFRRRLTADENIPSWFSLPRVVSILKKKMKSKGTCIYIFGLSGAGKTTLAHTLKEIIEQKTTKTVALLDGDEVRRNLGKGLGFSRQDRSTNVRRVGYVASLVAKTGGISICANIAPYSLDREWIRNTITKESNYVEVYLETPLPVCESRDVKGLYKKARAGLIENFTGVSDPFEEPTDRERTLFLDTTCTGPADCAKIVLSKMNLGLV